LGETVSRYKNIYQRNEVKMQLKREDERIKEDKEDKEAGKDRSR
jgi:hypothetical protein